MFLERGSSSNNENDENAAGQDNDNMAAAAEADVAVDNGNAANPNAQAAEEIEDELLTVLLGRLSGNHPNIAVDAVRARNLLEASAGNVEYAVALYWDDYMARRENRRNNQNNRNRNHQNHNNHPLVPPPPNNNNNNNINNDNNNNNIIINNNQESSASVSDDEVALLTLSSSSSNHYGTSSSSNANQAQRFSGLRKRKRILNASIMNSRSGKTASARSRNSNNNPPNDPDYSKKKKSSSAKRNNHDWDKEEDGKKDKTSKQGKKQVDKLHHQKEQQYLAMNRSNYNRNHYLHPDYNSDYSDSSSSSDEDYESDVTYSFLDELVRDNYYQLTAQSGTRKFKESKSELNKETDNKSNPSNETSDKANNNPENDNDNDDNTNNNLSEHNNSNGNKNYNNNNNSTNVIVLKSPTWLLWGYKSSKSEGDQKDTDKELDNDANKICTIPKTWHNAGFTLSKCTTGLSLSSPPEGLNRSNHNNNSKNKRPPESPHHCGAITALLSLVTAMMYAGVSIQGKVVNCNSTVEPWTQLSPSARKQQFEKRLANALSSILFIAAETAMNRKLKALEAMEKNVVRQRKSYRRMLQRKLSLLKKEKSLSKNKDFNNKNNIVSTKQSSSVDSPRKNNNEDDGSEQIHKKQGQLKRKQGDFPESKSIHDKVSGTNKNSYEEIKAEYDECFGNRNDDLDLMRRQRFHRRCHMCPVCTWEEDQSGESLFPSRLSNNASDEDDADNTVDKIRIRVSYTNIQDLKLFVQSNLRSFMGPGGCALLMENIIHIHGIDRVKRKITRLRTKHMAHAKDKHPVKITPLLKCACKERQIMKWEKTMEMQKKENSRPSLLRKLNFDATMPPGHECISVELLSLLLTGCVKSSFDDMDTKSLGIGFLSTKNSPSNCVTMDKAVLGDEKKNWLKYPLKPIWVICGESCYSVFWNDDLCTSCTKGGGRKVMERASELGNRSRNGSDSFRLEHWNCWHNLEQPKSSMRVITARKHATDDKLEKESSSNNNCIITNEELESITIHSDDETYFPNNYHRWRYSFGEISSNEGKKNDQSTVGSQEISKTMKKNVTWIPYFRLDKRQKQLVERKLAPTINLAVWSRWQDATVNDFQPLPNLEPIL